MATAPIAPTPSLNTAGLQLDDLLRVMLTELTHQDPFKPVDNKDFMSQIAQFASLDTSQQLNQNIVQLLALQALNQSVGLMNRVVSADIGGRIVRGRVTTITLADGAPRLTLAELGTNNVIPNVSIGQLLTISTN